MATAEAKNETIGKSIIESMRAKRKQIAGDKDITLEVPGYNGQLLVKYRHLSFAEVKRNIDRVNREVNKGNENAHLDGAADNLAVACEEVFWKETSDSKVIPLAESLGYETPVKFDTRLTEVLDIRGAGGELVESARECVLGVFDNDLAIMAHHTEFTEWLRGANKEVDEELAGESVPTAT